MGVAHYGWDVRLGVYGGLVRGCSAKSLAQKYHLSHAAVKKWAKLAGMELAVGAHGGLTSIDVDVDAAPPVTDGRTYRRLTLADRMFIQTMLNLKEPWSYRRIAVELGVAPSTISREVTRGRVSMGRYGDKYSAEISHVNMLKARPRPRPGKLDRPELWGEVVTRLNQKHSPQQIAKRLQVDFPDRKEMHVSYETIYQALYIQGKGAMRNELKVVKALRSGRTQRLPKSKLPPRQTRPWLDGARLEDRPEEVEDKSVPGHWEGDLVVGPQCSGLVTLIERNTRFALIGRLPGCRDSVTVLDVLDELITQLPQELTKTITWDQGSEMARHATFTIDTGIKLFFCDPHSPWQRGANENLNGLIRDYYPKSTNFNTIADTDIKAMQDQLNDRPRQTLDWATPREKLDALINSVAITV